MSELTGRIRSVTTKRHRDLGIVRQRAWLMSHGIYEKKTPPKVLCSQCGDAATKVAHGMRLCTYCSSQ